MLRQWWTFPLCGFVGCTLLGQGRFWSWVGLQSVDDPSTSMWCSKTWMVVLFFLFIPLLWRCGIPLGRFLSQKAPKIPWALAVSLLCVACVEWGVRSPLWQNAFWLAVRARAGQQDHFQRELSSLRLDALEFRSSDAPDPLIVIGSSQVLHGLDFHMLREMVKPRPVIRSAMFGMTPLKALSAWRYLRVTKKSKVLMWLSAFDFTNQQSFPIDWLRPLASWQGTPGVLSCYSFKERLQHRWKVVDLMVASSLELWRIRDYFHSLEFRFWGVSELNNVPAALSPQQQARMKNEMRYDLKLMPFELNAFQSLTDKMRTCGASLVVFEGGVNPELASKTRLQYEQDIRTWLNDQAVQHDFIFVPTTDQDLSLLNEDWTDMTHLNSSGRLKNTRYVAAYLLTMRSMGQKEN